MVGFLGAVRLLADCRAPIKLNGSWSVLNGIIYLYLPRKSYPSKGTHRSPTHRPPRHVRASIKEDSPCMPLRRMREYSSAAWLVILALILSTAVATCQQVSVTTYHYDQKRTGWNPQETILTPTNVASTSFGLLKSVSLDDQVDAQPLIAAGVSITAGKSKGSVHDVVYVATEGNTIYAIDAETGAV